MNLLRYFSSTTPHESARNTPGNYYNPGRSILEYSSLFSAPENKVRSMHPACIAALYVIWSNAMRSAEYLGLRVRDILGQDRVLVRGAKGSGSYIIVLPGISQQFRDAAGSDPARFVSGITYSQLYRACVRADIGAHAMSRLNLARTHLARYDVAAAVAANGIKTVSDCLRHRSRRSSLHYVDA
jgi:integrase